MFTTGGEILNSSINLCAVCKLQDANFVTLPCSHLAMCQSCVTSFDNCVICRADINHFLKIFRV